MTSIHSKIQEDAPKAWADFEKFYQEIIGSLSEEIKKINFLEFPFSMQFGVYIAYFQDNGMEMDVQTMNFEFIQTTVYEMFIAHERIMDHYS